VCTANQCRSPMAEALLRAALAGRVEGASVSSAGLFRGGVPASPGSVKALATRGLDLAEHRSRSVTPELLGAADLILGMAKLHVREVVVASPEVFPRTFTLKELVRRGSAVGPRSSAQPLAAWLAAVHEGRRHADLIGDDPADDISDPIGGPDRLYAATADELDRLVGQLVTLAWPVGSTP